jgi:hypothetical protein
MMPDPEPAARFVGDGYVAPLTALAPDAAARIVAGLAPVLDANGGAGAALRNNPHLLFTWADALIDHPRIVEAVSALIGPDLLVRDSVLFAKGPRDPTRVDCIAEVLSLRSRRLCVSALKPVTTNSRTRSSPAAHPRTASASSPVRVGRGRCSGAPATAGSRAGRRG